MVEIPVMVTKVVINIQEDKMVDAVGEIVVEWVLDMTAVQTLDMAVIAANLQEVSTETVVPAIGGLVAAIGEPVAMKVVIVTVDIPKINI